MATPAKAVGGMIARDDSTSEVLTQSPPRTAPRGGHRAGDHPGCAPGARRQGRGPHVDGGRGAQGRCGQEHALPPVAVQGRARDPRRRRDVRHDRRRGPRLAGGGHACGHRRGCPAHARPLHRSRVCRAARRVGPRPRGRRAAGARVAVDAAPGAGGDLGRAGHRARRDPRRRWSTWTCWPTWSWARSCTAPWPRASRTTPSSTALIELLADVAYARLRRAQR